MKERVSIPSGALPIHEITKQYTQIEQSFLNPNALATYFYFQNLILLVGSFALIIR